MGIQWKSLIERAKKDDQDAFSALYEHSYDAVYRTVKSMVKDEDTAMDIVQDAFVSGFANLDGLQQPENFIPWMRRIATNKARDWFRKKRPIAFSQLADEEDDQLDFEDENLDHAPEAVLDRSETARLIEEILGTLSEEQRIAVGMYYYEEMPVAEIAAALGVSENTIKSRLNYGRKKIKAGVEELEKKGTKLYSLAPIPFFIWLLRCQKAQTAASILGGTAVGTAAATAASTGTAATGTAATGTAAAGTAATGTAATGTAAAAGTAAGSAAAGSAGGFFATLGAKIVAGALAVSLVGGGAAAAISYAKRGDPAPEPSQNQTETAPTDDTQASAPETTEPAATQPPKEEGGEFETPRPTNIAFTWPVSGEITVGYSPNELVYDHTMGDWRVHDGVDIEAAQGTKVLSCASGVVIRVYTDDLMGTTVVIDHGAGIVSTVSHLADDPAVKEGDAVTIAAVIGSVGDTALGETNETPHIHFSLTVNGETADPTKYLPEK